MLIPAGDGTFTGGLLDVLVVLHDVGADTYHAAFYEERPMPGPIGSVDQEPYVRLRSKMHHTQGSTTFEGALVHLDEVARRIVLDDANVYRAAAVPWDGEPNMMIVENWRRAGRAFEPSPLPAVR